MISTAPDVKVEALLGCRISLMLLLLAVLNRSSLDLSKSLYIIHL